MNVAELRERSHIVFVKHGVCRGSVPRVHDFRGNRVVPKNLLGESPGSGVWHPRRCLGVVDAGDDTMTPSSTTSGPGHATKLDTMTP